MKLYIEKNYGTLSRRAADIVSQRIKKNPRLVWGLATGSTPLGMYRLLAKKYQNGELDFSQVVTFNLDEYIGLLPDDPQSYHFFMKKNLFSHVNINSENTFFPIPTSSGCKKYEKEIKKEGGIDLQILGIGQNGHIGFNEPGSRFNSRTRVVALTPATKKDNARFFGSINKVPRRAVTMGIATIMEAREIILLASGKNKKAAVHAALQSPITTKIPASILQKHKNLTVILDEEACPPKFCRAKLGRAS